jgi:hypothetical protein
MGPLLIPRSRILCLGAGRLRVLFPRPLTAQSLPKIFLCVFKTGESTHCGTQDGSEWCPLKKVSSWWTVVQPCEEGWEELHLPQLGLSQVEQTAGRLRPVPHCPESSSSLLQIGARLGRIPHRFPSTNWRQLTSQPGAAALSSQSENGSQETPLQSSALASQGG